MTQELLEPETFQEESLEEDTPWSVLVWNDPINLMSYVTFVFREVFAFSDAKAHKLMLDVHEKGRAKVFSGEKIEAEKYVQILHGYALWATMER